jgi:hypothetical protein
MISWGASAWGSSIVVGFSGDAAGVDSKGVEDWLSSISKPELDRLDGGLVLDGAITLVGNG